MSNEMTLNEEIFSLIFQYLPPDDCLRFEYVCRLWLNISRESDEIHWKYLCMKIWSTKQNHPLEKWGIIDNSCCVLPNETVDVSSLYLNSAPSSEIFASLAVEEASLCRQLKLLQPNFPDDGDLITFSDYTDFCFFKSLYQQLERVRDKISLANQKEAMETVRLRITAEHTRRGYTSGYIEPQRFIPDLEKEVRRFATVSRLSAIKKIRRERELFLELKKMPLQEGLDVLATQARVEDLKEQVLTGLHPYGRTSVGTRRDLFDTELEDLSSLDKMYEKVKKASSCCFSNTSTSSSSSSNPCSAKGKTSNNRSARGSVAGVKKEKEKKPEKSRKNGGSRKVVPRFIISLTSYIMYIIFTFTFCKGRATSILILAAYFLGSTLCSHRYRFKWNTINRRCTLKFTNINHLNTL